jgi:STE24 endopeptidase
MPRKRPPRLALLLAPLALSLLLSAGPTPAAPAPGDTSASAAQASTATPTPPVSPALVAARDSTAGSAPRASTTAARSRSPAGRSFASGVTDSARRAYRAWLRHLRARAVAESIARADSATRAAAARTAAPAGGRVPEAAGKPSSISAVTGAPDYLAQIRANFGPLNRAYATTRAALGFLEPLYGMLVALFLLFSGLSARLRDLAKRLGSGAYVQTLVYFALYVIASFVLGFPLTLYEGFGLEHRYGLSTEHFGGWFGQQLIALGVSIVFFGVVPLVRLAYAALERFPRRWWVALGLGTLPVILIGTLIEPVVIDPLFNRFTPLQDKRLEAQILDVARRAGIPARHVFQVDKSRQTVKYNAYVNGFGPSQRVVLWDTTLKGMTPDEILFVVGHEAGHYRLGHVWTGIVLASLLSFVLFWLGSMLMRGAVRAWGPRWGFTEVHDLASLPLFVLTLSLLSFLVQPGVNAFSRGIERQSDRFGLEVTRLNDAAARAFIKLGSQNRSNPDPSPFVEFFLYDHPPLLERVRFALSYRPWEEGKPNRYYRPGS